MCLPGCRAASFLQDREERAADENTGCKHPAHATCDVWSCVDAGFTAARENCCNSARSKCWRVSSARTEGL
eukprot:3210773-Rhodomonas_salina.1